MKIKTATAEGEALNGLVAKCRYTYTSDSCGYMLFKDGVSQGGARTLGTATHTSDGRRRAWQHVKADRKEYAATAQRLCDQYNKREPS